MESAIRRLNAAGASGKSGARIGTLVIRSGAETQALQQWLYAMLWSLDRPGFNLFVHAPGFLARCAAIEDARVRSTMVSRACNLLVSELHLSVCSGCSDKGFVSRYRSILPRLMQMFNGPIGAVRNARISAARLAQVHRRLILALCEKVGLFATSPDHATCWALEAAGLLNDSLWALRGVAEGATFQSGRGAAAIAGKHKVPAQRAAHELWIGLASTQA